MSEESGAGSVGVSLPLWRIWEGGGTYLKGITGTTRPVARTSSVYRARDEKWVVLLTVSRQVDEDA